MSYVHFKDRPAVVYFLRPIGARGPVKIGHSVNPEGRLDVYASWSPIPLELVARLSGPRSLERRFHAKFRTSWIHHEWFRWTPELGATLDGINERTFDVSTLPEGIALPTAVCATPWSESRRQRFELSREIKRLSSAGIDIPADVKAAWLGGGSDFGNGTRGLALMKQFLDAHHAAAGLLSSEAAR
jgi:hypothetical protein